MPFTIYLPVIFLWLMVFVIFKRQKQNKAIITRQILKKIKMENIEMKELAKQFIGKECLIYAFDSSHQFEGVIKEVSDGAMLVENKGKTEVINLDFVIRIREYPRNKKGQKKSIVLD